MEPETTCNWTEDWDGVWETGCDNAFVFEDGVPGDNHFKFCPYCGRGIVSVGYADLEEEE